MPHYHFAPTGHNSNVWVFSSKSHLGISDQFPFNISLGRKAKFIQVSCQAAKPSCRDTLCRMHTFYSCYQQKVAHGCLEKHLNSIRLTAQSYLVMAHGMQNHQHCACCILHAILGKRPVERSKRERLTIQRLTTACSLLRLLRSRWGHIWPRYGSCQHHLTLPHPASTLSPFQPCCR